MQIAWFFLLLVWLLLRPPDVSFFLKAPDHGCQLAWGWLLHHFGQVPFVHSMIHYGPGPALITALGFKCSHTLLPEVVICIVAYTVSLYIMFRLVVAGGAGTPPFRLGLGMVVSLLASCAVPHLYMWFFWLFPVLTLAGVQRMIHAEVPARWLVFTLGLVIGMGALFRHDMGAACLLVALLAIPRLPGVTLGRLRAAVRMVTGAAIAPMLWLAYLVGHAGWRGCWTSLAGVLAGSRGCVAENSKPLPIFSLATPFSHESGLSLFLAAMVGVAIGGVVAGGRQSLDRATDRFADSGRRMLFSSGLLTLLMLPAVIYRPDAQHLPQVLAPCLVCAALLFSRLWPGAGRQRLARRIVILAVVAAFVCSGWVLRARLGESSRWVGRGLAARYAGLAAGLEETVPGPPARAMALAIRRLTPPDAGILVAAYVPQVYYWADRHMSGMLSYYFPGIFADDRWRLRNLAAVEKDPPAAVVVDRGFFDPAEPSRFRDSQPELHRWVAARYTNAVESAGGLTLLMPGHGQAH